MVICGVYQESATLNNECENNEKFNETARFHFSSGSFPPEDWK